MKYFLLFTTLLISACATKDISEPPTELNNINSELSIKSSWSQDLGEVSSHAVVALTPHFDGDAVYLANVDGVISKLNSSSGELLSSYTIKDKIIAGLSGTSDELFYGTQNGDLVALSKTDSKELWRTFLKSEMLSQPVVALGLVIARTTDGNVQAFSIGSGDKVWSYKTTVPALSLRGNSTPVLVDDGLLLVASDNGRLIGLQANNGRVLFDTAFSLPEGASSIQQLNDIDMTPVFDGKILYVSSYKSGLSAVDIRGGGIVWQHPASTLNALAVDDEKIYFSDVDSEVWAVNRSTGETVWKQKGLRARHISAPLLVGDKIVLADNQGYLHALSKTDGRFVGRKETQFNLFVRQASDRRLEADKPSDHHNFLISPTSNQAASSAGQQDKFYFMTRTGLFRAFELVPTETVAK